MSADAENCSPQAPCEKDGCQECCPHTDRDSHCCLICGAETDWGAEIDRAMDLFEDR